MIVSMRRTSIAVAAFVLVGLLGLSASAAAKRPPVLHVLKGGWFQVSVHGSYAMNWSANEHGYCGGDSTKPQFLDAQGSETVTFASRRPVRAFLAETLEPAIGKRPPFPALLLRRRFYATGTKLVPNDFAPLKVATPANWMRSLSGTYQDCGEAPQTIVASGCGGFVTPRFDSLLEPIKDTRRYRGTIRMDVEERSNSKLPETRCMAQTDGGLPFPSHVIAFLNDSADAALRCPPPAAVVSSAIGTTTRCHFDNRDNRWLLSGVREKLIVTFRRIR
jgi:hypothetical protein